MLQRLIDVQPAGFYSHNTGGEHAQRVNGDERYVERLHQKHGLPVLEMTPYDYALGHDGYVMIHPEEGNGARPDLAGYVAARRVEASAYGFGFNIDSLLVDTEYRNQGIGSFLLGKLATKAEYTTNDRIMRYPEHLSIEAAQLDEDTAVWLTTRGFQETEGTLSLLLPGTDFMYVPSDRIREMQGRMPADWTGIIETVPATDDDQWCIEVYREGSLHGTVSRDWSIESDF